ncbi:MAG TPA: peptidase dimerization domain-containing protein [Pseudonocardiaceae bacterium]|nr:peptidase dimerization domain-containing protein [Pseudonocardiaceae bacterium]
MDKLVVGGRGVHRAKLHVYGVASHSGGSRTTPSAIEKAAHLIRVLSTECWKISSPRSITPGQVPGRRSSRSTPVGPPTSCLATPGLRAAIIDAARMVGVEVEAKVAGPSNIGNYLAGLGIPATAGFGVTYLGLHGTDERIRIDTIPPVQAIHHATVRTLLGVVMHE